MDRRADESQKMETIRQHAATSSKKSTVYCIENGSQCKSVCSYSKVGTIRCQVQKSAFICGNCNCGQRGFEMETYESEHLIDDWAIKVGRSKSTPSSNC